MAFSAANLKPLVRVCSSLLVEPHSTQLSGGSGAITGGYVGNPNVVRGDSALWFDADPVVDGGSNALLAAHIHQMCCSTFALHTSRPGGETRSLGIGGASETALRALQSFGQVNRMSRGSHFYVDQKAVKMIYSPGMPEAGSA